MSYSQADIQGRQEGAAITPETKYSAEPRLWEKPAQSTHFPVSLKCRRGRTMSAQNSDRTGQEATTERWGGEGGVEWGSGCV